jgi:hypothetical protein
MRLATIDGARRSLTLPRLQATGDRILESSTAETNTINSASSSGGNTVITLSDGSTTHLVGVSGINNSFFS